MPLLTGTDIGTKVVSKLTRRLLPFLFLLYIVNYLDRINVGFAALQMRGQLGFSDKVYGLGAGIFFAGYFFFQVPSNLALARVGARKWIAVIMVLGAAEAGFFPGMILYLRRWFPSAARARAVALFMMASPLAGVLGGPISGLLLGVHTAHLSGWQWLFLIEGLPAVLLGGVVLAYLTDAPEVAPWLATNERAWLIGELAREQGAHPEASRREVFAAFTKGKVWLLVLVYLGDTTCTYGVGLWLPSLIRSVSGVSNLIIGLLSAIPYVVTAIAMVLVGTHSDRTRERRWHLAGSAFIGALGLVCAAYSTSTVATIIFLSVTLLAAYSLLGPFWATSTELLSQTSAVAGIALINSFGNLGGFLGPYTIGMMRTWTGSFRGGLLAVAMLLGISGVMALLVFGKVMRRVPLAAVP
jgi:MFS transporter, ACS family, tartrate transporter